jgi:hypothetical protein
MSGVLLNDGQAHIVNVLFESTAVQNYYLALIQSTSNPALTEQIGSGITEVSGTDYARIELTRGTDWTITGASAACDVKEFSVGADGWLSANGFAVCLSDTENAGDAIFAEAFPAEDQGNKPENRKIQIVCNFEIQDQSE